MENVQKMKFRQYWRPVEDDLCEGMKVLQPAELVFVGFEK
jgi:CRISPR type III-associated protein (TIGR04423 family)